MSELQLPDRRDKVLRGLRKDGLGLEIGASFRPMVTPDQGYNVRTLDNLDQAGLIAKYHENPDPSLDVSQIRPVDYVWSGERFLDLVGNDRFDWIIASHVIEHVPDIIAFVNDCSSILTEDGILSLVVPDKRFEFDFYRPSSGIARVIDAHLHGDTRPSPGAVAEFALYASNKNGAGVWSRYDLDTMPAMISNAGELRNLVELVVAGEYRDCHVWSFTPSSFRLMMRDLFLLRYTDLQELSFGHTEDFEFFQQLSRKGSGIAMDRQKLAACALHEVF